MSRPEHLPLELLETFVAIADMDGDATAAADQMDLSQPTISKRLAALRRATTDPDDKPWLLLKGKRWLVTPEGQRVRGVVSDLLQRYRQMERFVTGDGAGRLVVSIACGQQAASGFLLRAIEGFLGEQPECRVRLSTPRGKARIEGVAGGQFDLAIVTDSPATIRQIARVDLYIQTLFDDRLVLAANPSVKSCWGKQWRALPTSRPVEANEIVGLPLILPEPDATRRKQFDEWMHRATGQPVDAVLETGGWQNILGFAARGLGIGLATQGAVQSFVNGHAKLAFRLLSEQDFDSTVVRLIARKAHGKDEPGLTRAANALRHQILTSGSHGAQSQF